VNSHTDGTEGCMKACQGLLLAVARCVRQQQQTFVVVSTRDGYGKLVHLASCFRIRRVSVHHTQATRGYGDSGMCQCACV